MMGMEKLLRYRAQIDEIDRQWVLALAKRFEITEEVGALKQRTSLPAGDPEREQQQVRALRSLATEKGLDPELVEEIFCLVTERVRERHRELGAQ